MKYIITNSLKLAFIYSLLAILYEVFLVNYQIYNTEKSNNWLEITLKGLQSVFKNICQCEWKNIKLIEITIWIFYEKIHYFILFLIIIKVYYFFRGQKKHPQISKKQQISLSQYERQKRYNTEKEVQKLLASRQYYQHSNRWQNDSDNKQEQQETQAWQQLQKQLYD